MRGAARSAAPPDTSMKRPPELFCSASGSMLQPAGFGAVASGFTTAVRLESRCPHKTEPVSRLVAAVPITPGALASRWRGCHDNERLWRADEEEVIMATFGAGGPQSRSRLIREAAVPPVACARFPKVRGGSFEPFDVVQIRHKANGRSSSCCFG